MKTIAVILFSVAAAFAQNATGWVDLGTATQIQGSAQNVCPPDHFGANPATVPGATAFGYVGRGTATDSINLSTVTVGSTVTVHTQTGLGFVTTNVGGVRISQNTGTGAYTATSPGNFIQGTVNSYTAGTLAFTVTSMSGTATVAAWDVTPALPFAVNISSSNGTKTITQMDWPFSGNCYNVIMNSNGGAVDTLRGLLLIWGGGHGGAGTGGNEIYILDPTNKVMKRINNPSIFDNIQTCSTNVAQLTDLQIDATDSTKVTSATHPGGGFTASDIYCQIHIRSTGSGGGASIGFFQILDVAGGVAYLNRSAGTVGTTGISYTQQAQQSYPSDGGPMTRHTFGTLAYDNIDDQFLAFEGPTPSGSGARNTWSLKGGTYQWTDLTLLPNYNGGQAGCIASNCGSQPYDVTNSGSTNGAYCAFDTNKAAYWCEWGGIQMLIKYTPATNTWQQMTLYSTFCFIGGVQVGACTQGLFDIAYDPQWQYLVFVGTDHGGSSSAPVTSWNLGVFVVDISGQDTTYSTQNWSSYFTACNGQITSLPNGTLGAGMNVPWPGVTYDTGIHRIVGYPWDGNTIYVMDFNMRTCAPQTIYTSPTVAAANYNSLPLAGIFNRYGYMPNLGQYILYKNIADDGYTFTLNASPSNGLGSSTLTCLDKDGDTYGVGPGCMGPDADDNDKLVYTTAHVVSKYGNINTYLQHIGYQTSTSSATVYCISTTGNDATGAASTNADTACTTPFATYAHIAPLLTTPPFIVIYRAGTYNAQMALASGNLGAAAVYMSYPGELATLTLGTGSVVTGRTGPSTHLYATICDNLKINANASGAGYDGGTYLPYPAGGAITHLNNRLTHLEITGAGVDSNVDINGSSYMEVVDNLMHDPYPNGGQHNIYMACATTPCRNWIVSRNITYNVFTGGYGSIHNNGRCTGCMWEQNIVYSHQGGIDFMMGVSNSYLRSNLIFNQGIAGTTSTKAFQINNYISGQCQPTNNTPSICPWDQTGNVIANNTFWVGTLDPLTGSGITATWGTLIANQAINTLCGNGTTSTGTTGCGNLGGNTYRNNIIYGSGPENVTNHSYYPAVAYGCSNCATGDPTNYFPTDLWQNNTVLVQLNGGNSTTNGLGLYPGGVSGWYPHDCTYWNSNAASGSGNCLASDPLFVNASTSNWNSPSTFNFNLQNSSPALGSGFSGAGVPMFDVVGTMYKTAPSRGALEQATVPCTISPTSVGPFTVLQPVSITFTPSSTCTSSSWTTGGTWPSGLTFNTTTGVLSGTVSNTAGSPLTATVTYNGVTNTYTPITVNAAPVVTTVCPLSPGVENVAYSGGSNVLTASPAGTTPDSWGLQTGALPSGLNISGTSVVGTPTVTGSFSFTLQVTDTNGVAGIKTCSMVVNPPAPTPAMIRAVGTPGSVTLVK